MKKSRFFMISTDSDFMLEDHGNGWDKNCVKVTHVKFNEWPLYGNLI